MDETHQVTRLSMAPLWVFAHMEQHFFECCLCRFQHYHLYEPCQEHKSLGGNGAAMGVLEVVNDTYVGSGFCENLPPSSSQLYIYQYIICIQLLGKVTLHRYTYRPATPAVALPPFLLQRRAIKLLHQSIRRHLKPPSLAW